LTALAVVGVGIGKVPYLLGGRVAVGIVKPTALRLLLEGLDGCSDGRQAYRNRCCRAALRLCGDGNGASPRRLHRIARRCACGTAGGRSCRHSNAAIGAHCLPFRRKLAGGAIGARRSGRVRLTFRSELARWAKRTGAACEASRGECARGAFCANCADARVGGGTFGSAGACLEVQRTEDRVRRAASRTGTRRRRIRLRVQISADGDGRKRTLLEARDRRGA